MTAALQKSSTLERPGLRQAPPRPLRVCAATGCTRTTYTRHCAEHNVRLGSVYNNRRWREVVRPAVLRRDNYTCVFCGQAGTADNPLDAAHLDPTQELLRQGFNVFNLERIVAAHRSCHNRNAPHLQVNRGGGIHTDNVLADIPDLASARAESGPSVGTAVFSGFY